MKVKIENVLYILKTVIQDSEFNVTRCFPYGSVVYHGHGEDVDILCVSDDRESGQISRVIDGFPVEIQIINEEEMRERLVNHHIVMLEGYSLWRHFRDFVYNFDDVFEGFEVDNVALRHSVSSICSNSFVKAKKKLTVEKDYNRYASFKSLFHCLRMYDFGIQVARYGSVYSFSASQHIYDELYTLYRDNNDREVLEHINGKYKKLKNSLATEFRSYASKE